MLTTLTNFAAVSLSELGVMLVGVFGAFGGLMLGFYRFTEKSQERVEKRQEAERKAFLVAVEGLSKSNERVAVAVERQANEAEKRNGHLAEITAKNGETIMEALKILQKGAKKQTIEHQTIQESTVQESVVEHEVIKNKDEVS